MRAHWNPRNDKTSIFGGDGTQIPGDQRDVGSAQRLFRIRIDY